MPARLVVGLRTCFFSVDSDRNNIGEKVPPLWARFLPRLNEIKDIIPGVCYGIIRQTEPDSDLLEYIAAVQVERATQIPKDMTCYEIPEATYATFAHRGEVRNLDHTVNYVYSTWLAQSGRRHSYGADLEIYGGEYDAVSATSVIYYGIPLA